MLRTFHAAARIQDAVESSLRLVSRRTEATQIATIEAGVLRRLDTGDSFTASKPLLMLQHPNEDRYLLKLAPPDLLAAEVLAYELRRLGRRPCVPARIVTLELEDLGQVQGLLKPYIEFDGSRVLAADTQTWTPLQRAVLLVEHAWEWFLDNLDTNAGQYALLGQDGVPLNLDWDRAFAGEARTPLSRYAKYKATLPNARTFLYADFVEGRVELPFSLLRAEARRIRRLPTPAVRELVSRYASVRFPDVQAREEFTNRVLARKRRIELEFSDFIRDLLAERRQLAGHPIGVRARAHALFAVLWKRWQIVLHYVGRGPIGRAGRALLRFVRGRKLTRSNVGSASPQQDAPAAPVNGAPRLVSP